MSDRVRELPECRKVRVRRFDDTYETVRQDIESGKIPTKGGGGNAEKAFTKKEVEAMFVDLSKRMKTLEDAVARIEKKAPRGKEGAP